MHKLTKTILHVWISLVSVVVFAFGWAFLAHAQKPAPLVLPNVQVITASQPVLEPIPTINDLLVNGTNQTPLTQSPSVTFPRFHTRGS